MPDLFREGQFDGPVIGIDEAGRGPVTWSGNSDCHLAVSLSYDNLPADIDDSKKIKSDVVLAFPLI